MPQVQLEAFFLVQNACNAFPSTLVSMLELSPPLPILLLLRVAGLSGLNTIIVHVLWRASSANSLNIYRKETFLIKSCMEELKHTSYAEHSSLVSLIGFRCHSLYIKCFVKLKYIIAIEQFRFTMAT
jgi:hypothetical protein